MSDPVRFLTALSQTLSSVALYGDEHPATARAQEKAHQRLLELQSSAPRLEFTFLGKEVLFGEEVITGLQGWDWNTRLSEAGIERLEFTERVDSDQFTRFLDQVAARMGLRPSTSAEVWQMGQSAIRFGQVALRGRGNARAQGGGAAARSSSAPPRKSGRQSTGSTARSPNEEDCRSQRPMPSSGLSRSRCTCSAR